MRQGGSGSGKLLPNFAPFQPKAKRPLGGAPRLRWCLAAPSPPWLQAGSCWLWTLAVSTAHGDGTTAGQIQRGSRPADVAGRVCLQAGPGSEVAVILWEQGSVEAAEAKHFIGRAKRTGSISPSQLTIARPLATTMVAEGRGLARLAATGLLLGALPSRPCREAVHGALGARCNHRKRTFARPLSMLRLPGALHAAAQQPWASCAIFRRPKSLFAAAPPPGLPSSALPSAQPARRLVVGVPTPRHLVEPSTS